MKAERARTDALEKETAELDKKVQEVYSANKALQESTQASTSKEEAAMAKLKGKVAAIVAALAAAGVTIPTAAQAQYFGPGPVPVFNWLFHDIPNVVGGFGAAYGYHGPGPGYAIRPRYGRRPPPPPPGYCPPGVQASRVETRTRRVEHPFTSGEQYRCFADGRPSGGPGTGTGWCRQH